MRAEHADLREKIAGGNWKDDTQAALKAAVAAFAEDFGYDLDEEGQPIDEHAAPPVPARPSAGAAHGEDDGDGDADADGMLAAAAAGAAA